jgi:hypothetical protein
LKNLESLKKTAEEIKRDDTNVDEIIGKMGTNVATNISASVDTKMERLRLDLLKAFETFSMTSNKSITQEIVLKCEKLVFEGRIIATSYEILKSLHFKSITSREAIIKDAHISTFEWLYDGPNTEIGQETQFVNWLQQGTGVYWISGKAGAGKSTLMKHLVHDPRTKSNLKTWAGKANLVIASHFFWSGGNSMQKSQIGLLQSLLYQLLKQCPELAPRICPRRWIRVDKYEQDPNNFDPWTLQELSDTFNRLSDQKDISTRFCLLVDGLDEYDIKDGEHSGLINVLQDLARNDHIKLCVSSRPWNVFNKAFSGTNTQRLVLQNYTKCDIERYVKDQLEEDTRFSTLSHQDDSYYQLITEIVDKSNGVFLWVFLVVRSLLRGLTDDNDMTALLVRLSHLPADLEDYFRQMLDSVEDVYQVETAQILLIALTAKEDLATITLTTLAQVMKAPCYAIDMDLRTKPINDFESIADAITVHINARCKDILEPYMNTNAPEFLARKIGFLHRSARDFLQTNKIQTLLHSRVPKNFDPRTTLCSLYLGQIKSLPLVIHSFWSMGFENIEPMIYRMLHYAREVEKHSGSSPIMLLDELRNTLLQRSNELEVLPNLQHYFLGWSVHSLRRFFNAANFANLIVHGGLGLYLDYLLQREPALDKDALLRHSLRFDSGRYTKREVDMSMVRSLLRQGADSNAAWPYFVKNFVNNIDERFPKSHEESVSEICKVMLEHGADPQCKPSTESSTAAESIRRRFQGNESLQSVLGAAVGRRPIHMKTRPLHWKIKQKVRAAWTRLRISDASEDILTLPLSKQR